MLTDRFGVQWMVDIGQPEPGNGSVEAPAATVDADGGTPASAE
jgi:hypothetical protein